VNRALTPLIPAEAGIQQELGPRFRGDKAKTNSSSIELALGKQRAPYWDGRDVRAVTPDFDWLCPAMTTGGKRYKPVAKRAITTMIATWNEPWIAVTLT
jgi:hypothetical protein